ncbi:MAG TPA: hypothetical protein VG738_03970 [Chitinophagaceae bacterium]|nr:hypothetical protein [Chitinophagaceae bacterium]
MRKIVNPLLAIFIFLSTNTFAQKKDTSYIYLDSGLNVTSKKQAVCVEKVYPEGGLWHVIVAYVHQPYKIMTGSYKESNLELAEGWFEYFKNDTLIMNGNYYEGMQTGLWRKWTTDGLITDSVYFDKGHVVSNARFQYHANNHLWRYSLETDTNNKITRIFDTADVLISEGHFKDKDGEMFFYYPNGKVKTHTVYKNGERTLYEAFDEEGKRI